ncbi:hypothetical protein CPB86DRAFT_739398, partial [Serendipita vermifera]
MIRFCRAMAMYPAQLTALENLSLHEPPEWDIYFIMVKRRNIPSGRGFVPFRSLTLTCHPKELINPLIALLKGQFPKDVSLFDLSYHTAANLVRDISVDGCISCLMCLNVCPMQFPERITKP